MSRTTGSHGGSRRQQEEANKLCERRAAEGDLDDATGPRSGAANRLPDAESSLFPVWCRLTEPKDPVAGWAAPAGRPPPCGTCAGAAASDFGGSARAAHVTRGDRPAEGARTQAGSGRFCCRPPAPERIQRPGNKISFRGVFVTSSPRPRRVRSPGPFDAAATATS